MPHSFTGGSPGLREGKGFARSHKQGSKVCGTPEVLLLTPVPHLRAAAVYGVLIPKPHTHLSL